MSPVYDFYTPEEAEIVEFIEEFPSIITLRLRLTDIVSRRSYKFLPGQFNMVYIYGIGEIAISIVNDREFKPYQFEHTIQVVGRVTKALEYLKRGDRVGIRGAFGSFWPLNLAHGKDVVIISGGLGNAPLVAAIEEIMANRSMFGKVYIIQGVKDTSGLIYQDRYTRWHMIPNTEVLLTATLGEPFGLWKWYKGFVTTVIDDLRIDVDNTIVMTVGPEIMMKNVARQFIQRNVSAKNIFVSLERSMKCAVGHCGHCQMGAEFICKDGAVYAYADVAKLLEVEGI